MYKLFMDFENPTEALVGTRKSVQGFAVHGDVGFVLFHTGICAAYGLKERCGKPLGVFKLGSYNEGEPDARYANHANDAMFGSMVPGEAFPLLYVTAGNSGDSDEKGYIAYCAVEQIRLKDGHFQSETVQKIYYKNDGIEQSPYKTPGWGWPASLVDTEGGFYYMLSAKYRTKRPFSLPDNEYIVTKFPLPPVTEKEVVLTPGDILEQFELPFTAYATQGGTVRDGKIWYLFGFGREDYPDALRVIDLKTHSYALSEDLSGTPFGDQEVECCAFYGDRFLINTQGEKIYERMEGGAIYDERV